MSRKLWGDMTAAERLAAKTGYIQYNYGHGHALTVAAEAGDQVRGLDFAEAYAMPDANY